MNLSKILGALCIVLFVAACESSEDRAEAHYQSGLELLEAGDVDRALVELRNVFDLNGSHREARTLYASVLYDRGDLRGAYGNYLRLVEQYPDDLEGRVALAEMAFSIQDWDEFERHGTAAVDLAPDELAVRIIAVGLAYRQAVLDEDFAALPAIEDKIGALRTEAPESETLRRLSLDGLVRRQEFGAALREVDTLIEADPDDREAYDLKLGLLAEMGDDAGLEAHLLEMVERFPDDDTPRDIILRFYAARADIDRAEDFLRSISDPDAAPPSEYLSLINLLLQQRGPETALAELDRVLATDTSNRLTYQALSSAIIFDQGQTDQAITALERALEDRDGESISQANDASVTLARMLADTGNEVGARRLIEEILSSDATHVAALKMQAGWLIAADDTDGAIDVLRQVLDQEPQDAEAMTLMAEAYTRAGNHELARDFLSIAVGASGQAPAESLRYARVLIEDERYLPAEDTLLSALRLAPASRELIRELGRLYLAMDDLARAEQVARSLRSLGSDAATGAATALEAEIVARREGAEAALSYLSSLAENGEATVSDRIVGIQIKMGGGETGPALELAEELARDHPDNPAARFALAATQSLAGNFEAARDGYAALAADFPQQARFWMELARLHRALGSRDQAVAAIDEGLENLPGNPDLLWAKASDLEQVGDPEGAIAIYEELYERASGSVVVANNLASLLSTWRTDEESLERAFTIARRLRGTEVPAFQDTYGRILYLRGDYEEALTYLEPAAAGLPQDPLVLINLAQTYTALERPRDALTFYRAALEVAGDVDTRPQIVAAREAIETLEPVSE